MNAVCKQYFQKACFYSLLLMLWILTVKAACSSSPSSSCHHYLEHQAYVEVEQLIGAIRACYSELGHFPLTNFVSNPKVIDMLPVLCGKESVEESKKINPKNIILFAHASWQLKDHDYVDPWGSPYHVILKDGKQPQERIGGYTYIDNVRIWSNGPNKIDDNGQKDDICSWKIDERQKKYYNKERK